MLIAGSCHCGNISLTLQAELPAAGLVARACDCSFCTRHGARWTAPPHAVLKVHFKDQGLVTPYAFATRTATFHVCARCGVVPLASSRIDGQLYAVVNANALTGLDPALLRQEAASFAAEDADERLARRKRNWIAAVELTTGDA